MSGIVLQGVGKRFRQFADGEGASKRLLRVGGRAGVRELWALKDVSFTLGSGESLGVIGRNGSGKTTLLKLLSGVSAPTVGRLRVSGRIAPLIGIGVGFNPELTGRENVTINGQMLGMSARQVARCFDSIVDFSEIEKFIDTPVKYYSSGMFLRLAFAVAIHTDPEILILDEIMAVGDAAFQLKCNERMREIRARGASVVIVTHNTNQLPSLAPRTIVLSHGVVVFDGETADALGAYHDVMQQEFADRARRDSSMLESGQRFAGGATVSVELIDELGRPCRSFPGGGHVWARIRAEFVEPTRSPVVGVMLAPTGQAPLYTLSTMPGDYDADFGPGRPLEAEFLFENRLLRGSYAITGGVYDGDGEFMLGTSMPETFAVTSESRGQGVVDLVPRLAINGEEVEIRPQPGV